MGLPIGERFFVSCYDIITIKSVIAMRMFSVEGKNLPDAYHKALYILENEGKVYPCPDYNTTMKEVAMTFYVEDALAEPFISKLFPGGHHELQQYTMEICDGILDFMVGADANVWEYTYHQRFAHQLPWIIEELTRNPYSRRAIMNIRDFDVDSSNDHPACLQSIHFSIRENKLHMTVMMRSNDAVQATFMNAVGFISLQKKVAEELKVPVGSYTHIAYSFHAYENCFERLTKYAKNIETKDVADLTYPYTGFYENLMKEEIPSIMAMVNDQKAKYNIK